MAKEFFGQLNVEFETKQDVTTEQFKQFKKAFNKMVSDEWEMALYDLAEEHGFDIESINPISEDSSYPLKERD